MPEHSLSGKAKIAGVIGWPVSHSLSPRLHNYWLSRMGIDGAYIPLSVKPEDIETVIRALPKMGFAGANLTLPHKELVVPLLDAMDDDARSAGMANTIVIGEGGKLFGMNTDSYGFAENIRPHIGASKNKAVLLGAGGAAKAVCYALIKLGYKEIVVVNRSQLRADELASQFAGEIATQTWESRSQALRGADLLVNATSLGMAGKEALTIDLAALPVSALVTDIVYTPLMTPLLMEAKTRGNTIVDGLGMLLHQAVPGFSAWFGATPQVDEALRHYMISGGQ